MKRFFVMGFILLIAATPLHAADKWLQNDGFESGGTAYYQMGFVAGEIMASVFVPDPGDYPCKIKTVRSLVQDGAAGGTVGAFVLTIWADTGGQNPGQVLFNESYQLTAGDAYNEVDLSAENIIIESGGIRIGYEHVLDPPPSFCRDADGNIQSQRNLIYGNVGMGWNWYWTEMLGLQGDWIHRVLIDTNYSSATPTPPPPTDTPTVPPPTETPTMTNTSVPTDTPMPTMTPTPTMEPSPGTPTVPPPPTLTPTPEPPTLTPTHTPTELPTNTPTEVPTTHPTATQVPPTDTPVPTATAFPSVVYWDAEEYFGPDAFGIITVEDANRNIDPLAQETAMVKIWSQSTDPFPGGITVTLYEEGTNSYRFKSVYPHVRFGTASRPEDGVLGIADGEVAFVRYIDAATAQERFDQAMWYENTLSLTFQLPDTHFSEGDTFSCDLHFHNAGTTVQVDLYVLLDVYGEFFSYPTWQNIATGLDRDRTFIPGGEEGTIEILPAFIMPPVDPLGPLYFYGCMFEAGQLSVETLLTNVAISEFYFD